MNKNDIPQDPSALDKFTKEVCYAVDESGNYVTNQLVGEDGRYVLLSWYWLRCSASIS